MSEQDRGGARRMPASPRHAACDQRMRRGSSSSWRYR